MRLEGRLPFELVPLALIIGSVGVVSLWLPAWPLTLGAGAMVAWMVVLGVRAVTTRFVLETTPEPTLELGSVFGRRRVPLSSLARVRRGLVGGGHGRAYDIWEALGHDGARLARSADLGLRAEELRALETELRLWRVPLERG
ncbi:hypothetical protein [Agrococcus jenensis]|uniref:Uncharacterized protein n=1 Tax=Agrococcus jenensis TaxID=46353 RepID=A0A3N2APB5_9MICO|nr:hypothetical protein [Agrococcus jenensis]ROR64883.1 hypothetical protein EDD26_0235 [Agrococcus jenensis]